MNEAKKGSSISPPADKVPCIALPRPPQRAFRSFRSLSPHFCTRSSSPIRQKFQVFSCSEKTRRQAAAFPFAPPGTIAARPRRKGPPFGTGPDPARRIAPPEFGKAAAADHWPGIFRPPWPPSAAPPLPPSPWAWQKASGNFAILLKNFGTITICPAAAAHFKPGAALEFHAGDDFDQANFPSGAYMDPAAGAPVHVPDLHNAHRPGQRRLVR